MGADGHPQEQGEQDVGADGRAVYAIVRCYRITMGGWVGGLTSC